MPPFWMGEQSERLPRELAVGIGLIFLGSVADLAYMISVVVAVVRHWGERGIASLSDFAASPLGIALAAFGLLPWLIILAWLWWSGLSDD